MSQVSKCPCKSGQLYKQCCKRLHEGGAAKTALELMRSRFSAYALRLVDYVIDTTHPENSGRQSNIKAWRKDLLKFADQTRFDGLEISDFTDGESIATVTFTAHLRQGNQNTSFTEKSTFEKIDGRWLYKSGVMQGMAR